MYRCLAFAVALSCLHASSLAQMQRRFPADALRGEIVVNDPPIISLNGDDARLAPGSRIRGPDNMQQLSGTLIGTRLSVNYTLDTYGLVRDVWILKPEELRVRPWPRTPLEAKKWQFDSISQTWSKP